MNKPSQFWTPYQFDMPENTSEEDAALLADNEVMLKKFINQNRKQAKPLITFPMALLIAPVPAILLLLGALALGWRP